MDHLKDLLKPQVSRLTKKKQQTDSLLGFTFSFFNQICVCCIVAWHNETQEFLYGLFVASKSCRRAYPGTWKRLQLPRFQIWETHETCWNRTKLWNVKELIFILLQLDLKKWLISDPSDSSFKRLVWNYSPLKFPRKSIKKHSFPCAPWWPRRPNEPCRFDSSPSWWQFTVGGEKK